MRQAGAKKELEAEFGAGEIEGTLVLTNKRLIFVCTNEKEDNLAVPEGIYPFGKISILYSDVEAVDQIPRNPPNVFVSISSISSVKGHREVIGRPSLEVAWSDSDGGHALVFSEVLTGSRKRNLNDWAPIVENLKAGKQKLTTLQQPPSTDTLEGKIMRVLADMQEKGVFAIEGGVENEFKIQLDPDEVQTACDQLSSKGFLIRHPDSSGDVFYRRVSPLGEDNSSS